MFREFRRRQKKRSFPEISLTPLIDTSLTLLVIFMVTTPIIQNNLKIDLPKSKTNEVNDSFKELVVYIDKSGKISINNDLVEFSKIENYLKEKIGVLQNQRIYINADKSLSYGVLIDVVDYIKRIPGIAHVILSTERK